MCHNLVSNSQDMIEHRLSSLRKTMSDLLVNIAADHYQSKLSQVFLINNLNYISEGFKQI
jgi:hypothetical protein